MNRRKFLKLLGLATGATVVPGKLVASSNAEHQSNSYGVIRITSRAQPGSDRLQGGEEMTAEFSGATLEDVLNEYPPHLTKITSIGSDGHKWTHKEIALLKKRGVLPLKINRILV